MYNCQDYILCNSNNNELSQIYKTTLSYHKYIRQPDKFYVTIISS